MTAANESGVIQEHEDSPEKPPLRVLYATSELAGLSSTGGLGAVSYGLVAALRRRGVTVDLVTPDYFATPLDDERSEPIEVPHWVGHGTVRSGRFGDLGEIHLVSLPGTARAHPYQDPQTGHGWGDNDHRFFSFSAAVASLARGWKADVCHLNDWQTATAIGHLPESLATVMSVHNLAHQGWADGGWTANLGGRGGAFEVFGSVNALAGGIRLADRVVAVSPTFALEIRSDGGGMGLAEDIRARGDDVIGILNGIDTAEWGPRHDPFIAAQYSAHSRKGKLACKAALCHELGLDAELPLAIMVARLDHQKGADLLGHIAPFLSTLPLSVAILGAGDHGLEDHLAWLAQTHAGRFAFVRDFDNTLAHRMFAAGDFTLIPSRFEPCGLTQMQGMRYGAIPIATDVGGLHDTVIDVDERPDDGSGIVFHQASPTHLLDALHRATRLWSNRRRFSTVQHRVMLLDWSWDGPAAQYEQLYREVRAAHEEEATS